MKMKLLFLITYFVLFHTSLAQQYLQFGSQYADQIKAVWVDSSDNIFLGGYTAGTLPGCTAQGVAGANDGFIAKYDSNRNLIFIKQFGSTWHDYVYAMVIDGNGNIIVGGYTEGSFPSFTNAGYEDAFFAKFDSSGNQVYVQQFGYSANDDIYAVAVDSSNNIYVAGITYGSFPSFTSAGSYDCFYAKYDSSGNRIYVQQFGTATTD